MASLCRYLESPQHRTRFINFFFVAQWDPAVALRQKARKLLVVLHPRKGDTLYLVIDDSKKATRGVHMHAVAKMQDPVRAGYVRGHQYVCAILRFRDQVMPDGLRLYVKPEHCSASDLPFHQPTECAAPLMRACEAPAGVTVLVLVDPDELCGGVVQACREGHVRFASTLQSHRSPFNTSWKLQAGRSGRNLCRRRRTATLVLAKPHGKARDRFVEAGWIEESTLGPLHNFFSRKGSEQPSGLPQRF